MRGGGVVNEDERECACLGLKRGRREGHKRKQNQVVWRGRGVAYPTNRAKVRLVKAHIFSSPP